MPPADELLQNLRDEIAEHRVLAVIGAGVSMGATKGDQHAAWTGLIESGIKQCLAFVHSLSQGWAERVREEAYSEDLDERLSAAEQVSRKLGAPHGPEYRIWLRKTVGSLRLRDRTVLEALRALPVTLATTNYDGLIEEVTGRPPVTWRDHGDVERVLRGEDQGIVHLHGFWKKPESVIFSLRSYEEILRDAHAQTMLQALRSLRTLLFVGCGDGLSDPNFGAFLRWSREVLKSGEARHFRLCRTSEVAAVQAKHPEEERIFALPYGRQHSDLADFLHALAPSSAALSGPTPAVAQADHGKPMVSEGQRGPRNLGLDPPLATRVPRQRKAAQATRAPADPQIAITLLQRLPTPLAFQIHYSQEHPEEFISLERAVRFVSLLALHDCLVHGLFSGIPGKAQEAALLLPKQNKNLEDWQALLGFCDEAPPKPRFLPELYHWHKSVAADLFKLAEAWNKKLHRGSYLPDAQKTIPEIFATLGFLREYLLVLVVQPPDRSRKIQLRPLTGPGMIATSHRWSSNLSEPIFAHDLLLLDLRNRKALNLSPAFHVYSTQLGHEEILGLQCLKTDSQDLQAAAYTSLSSAQGVVMSRSSDLPETKTDDVYLIVKEGDNSRFHDILPWIGEPLMTRLFHAASVPKRQIRYVFPLLGDAGWAEAQQYSRSVNVQRIGSFNATRLLRQGDCGGLVDLYLAEIADDPDKMVVIHLLREPKCEKPVRKWFLNRLTLWRNLDHPNVLQPRGESDAGLNTNVPFLALDYSRGWRSLEDILRADGPLEEASLRKAVRTIINVCLTAHQRGLRLLLTLPHHLFLDHSGDLLVTVPETICSQKPAHSREFWRRFCSDWQVLAPELREDLQTAPETVDVFALGVLLSRLRGSAGLAMPRLDPPRRLDPWECVIYHCLAEDPCLRFQSIMHLDRFFDIWLTNSRPWAPSMITISDNPPFEIGEFPVTNFEYEHFCSQTHHALPFRRNSDRLRGPLCPVLGVSLGDAEEYCRWLSRETNQRWRVPSQEEWLRAARPDDRLFPWGDQHPCTLRANFSRYFDGPTVVGAFSQGRSAAGCYDLAGNVWEWTSSRIKGTPKRALKGGAYHYSADEMKIEHRQGAIWGHRSEYVGFRVLREVE